MDALQACSIIEAVEDASEQELLEAWQFLVDTGIVWQLQGVYGRTAMNLINDGVINPPKEQ